MFLDTENKEDLPTLSASLKVKKATIEQVWGTDHKALVWGRKRR